MNTQDRTDRTPTADSSSACALGRVNKSVGVPRGASLEDRYVPEPNTGCWLWLGAEHPQGYGRWNREYAHRVVYELLVGPIPPGADLCHKCDTPQCVNPAHLFVGSVSDNLRDFVKKGRCGTAKITSDQAVEMRRLYAEGYSVNQLRLMFSLSRTATQKVVKGESWKDAA
jgi:hypothetical protein